MNKKEKNIILNHLAEYAQAKGYYAALMEIHAKNGDKAQAEECYNEFNLVAEKMAVYRDLARELGISFTDISQVYSAAYDKGQEIARRWNK